MNWVDLTSVHYTRTRRKAVLYGKDLKKKKKKGGEGGEKNGVSVGVIQPTNGEETIRKCPAHVTG